MLRIYFSCKLYRVGELFRRTLCDRNLISIKRRKKKTLAKSSRSELDFKVKSAFVSITFSSLLLNAFGQCRNNVTQDACTKLVTKEMYNIQKVHFNVPLHRTHSHACTHKRIHIHSYLLSVQTDTT